MAVREGRGRAVLAHLFLTKGGRKAEQIHKALVVNQLLMREEEKH